jgi:hypothetical protein
MTILGLSGKVLLYVAECRNIKELNSMFCTSFLEVQIGYKVFIKVLYIPIIDQKYKNLNA